MDASESEYEQPSLLSSMRKRKRSTEHESSRARKKRKPALDDLRKLLVTYHGLQQMQRELNKQLALCEHQIAKHKFGSVSGKPRRRRGRSRGRPYAFPRVRSPLREVVRVEEDLPKFLGRVGEWLWRMDHFGDWWFSLARPQQWMSIQYRAGPPMLEMTSKSCLSCTTRQPEAPFCFHVNSYHYLSN
ncbi:hypothetical protein PENSOL_c077G09245 [Penicillium solitum]|uniref:Uncharacterized protein n=1 Tax=Penicillium solitum TaxID=60172 RepID=A0A1V6QDY1_9EURO|nr:uncharacterized protein PENSOL_c077G09245 [Penicillium solitum]OQD87428.1 hypothetical protein PENSOL_c077G09245 [Penicillium solitum]